MKGFVEVTEKVGKCNVLLSVGKITAIVDMDDGVYIETGVDRGGKSTGISVCESYSAVKEKIINCED